MSATTKNHHPSGGGDVCHDGGDHGDAYHGGGHDDVHGGHGHDGATYGLLHRVWLQWQDQGSCRVAG